MAIKKQEIEKRDIGRELLHAAWQPFQYMERMKKKRDKILSKDKQGKSAQCSDAASSVQGSSFSCLICF